MKEEQSLANASETADFRMRLRFRVVKSFHSTNFTETVIVDGRDVTLKSATPDEPLNQAKWVILGANGFNSEGDALLFGTQLRRAIQVASLVSRNGVDCGKDVATSRWGSEVRQAMYEQTGKELRSDVHGIDVFKNDGSALFLNFQAKIEVHAGVSGFLNDLAKFYPWMSKVTPKAERILIMLNNVLINPEPVAQIVLAISTVESLGQDQQLSPAQNALLAQMANLASHSKDVAPHEAVEIADAILKIHKLSLRQGVLRLLSTAKLDLKKEWDAIYAERSTLVHGLAPQPGVEYGALAHRTINLCVRILHRLIAMEIGEAELDQVSLENFS
jgi:hypothetical protein